MPLPPASMSLVEKPIAINAREGAEMVDAGHKSGKKFQVGLNVRFGAGPQAIKRFVDDGKLGDIYYARAHALRRRGIPGWGVFTQKDKQGRRSPYRHRRPHSGSDALVDGPS